MTAKTFLTAAMLVAGVAITTVPAMADTQHGGRDFNHSARTEVGSRNGNRNAHDFGNRDQHVAFDRNRGNDWNAGRDGYRRDEHGNRDWNDDRDRFVFNWDRGDDCR